MLYSLDPDPIFSAKIETVIRVSVDRGSDKKDDPLRYVTQYWSLEGKLLAEHDPIKYCPEVDQNLTPSSDDAGR